MFGLVKKEWNIYKPVLRSDLVFDVSDFNCFSFGTFSCVNIFQYLSSENENLKTSETVRICLCSNIN